MPTTQIYRQTILSLKDRDHPYRQHLDLASGGRTVILEKTDRFSPLDVKENLVVLMLMLPSANRQTKETLKVFKDSGGFQDFFPPEDDVQKQEKIRLEIPNLDTYEKESGFWGKQVKTSLGNTLRTLSPVIILDEGHKAYSQGAQNTLRGFNPCIIIELSATPSKESNILVDISGRQLQLSLFEFVPEDEFNETEKAVAWYLEGQKRLFFWYRNRSRQDYAIQGWRKYKIFPDFIFTATSSENKNDYEQVYVVETKGLHLTGSPDTDYKRKMFSLCTEEAKSRRWSELGLVMKEKVFRFEVLAEDEWEVKFNEMLQNEK